MMKKHIAVALISALILCGCSSGITREAYDEVAAQRDAAQNEIDVLNGQLDVYEQMLEEHDELISQRDTALAENEILRSQIAQYEQQANGQELPATETAPETEQPIAPPAEVPDAPTTIENTELKTRGPITITKNPYGETAVEESRTWFIAHAENWDVVNWFFISPIDGKTYTVDGVRTMFPTFTLKSNSPDTISFVNIPLGFDGWQLYARFENADGYADTAKAAVEVVSYADAYAPVFEELDKYLPMPWEEKYERYCNNECTYLAYIPFKLGEFDQYKYALIDLDDNGIKELLIGGGDRASYGEWGWDSISALYTLVSGKPVKIFECWERFAYFLLDDNSIYRYVHNPWMEHLYFEYDLVETELVFENGVLEDHREGAVYARSIGENCDYAVYTDEQLLTYEEFSAIRGKYESRIVSIPYITRYIS